jgi:hypothetical protein
VRRPRSAVRHVPEHAVFLGERLVSAEELRRVDLVAQAALQAAARSLPDEGTVIELLLGLVLATARTVCMTSRDPVVVRVLMDTFHKLTHV